MFPELRRKGQALSAQDCAAVLQRGSCGVLALSGADGYPYAVPLSYLYEGKRLYFHCAKQGHKLDAISHNPKASFCVIDQDKVVPTEYTTYFRSVIAFGMVRILEPEEEKLRVIEALARKYAPSDSSENRRRAITREAAALCVLEMQVSHLSGKQAIELVRGGDAPKMPQPI